MQLLYEKAAWVYKIGETVYAGPYVTTANGVRVEGGPIQSFSCGDYGAAEKSLRTALDNFRTDNGDDLVRKLQQEAPILKASGLKSYRAISRVSKFVEIVEFKDRIEISPSETNAPHGGYTQLLDQTMTVGKHENLAEALFRALKIST